MTEYDTGGLHVINATFAIIVMGAVGQVSTKAAVAAGVAFFAVTTAITVFRSEWLWRLADT